MENSLFKCETMFTRLVGYKNQSHKINSKISIYIEKGTNRQIYINPLITDMQIVHTQIRRHKTWTCQIVTICIKQRNISVTMQKLTRNFGNETLCPQPYACP